MVADDPSQPSGSSRSVPPWSLALGAMTCVQLGSALSVPVVADLGPAATAWLRLTAGAVFFLALTRPPLRSVRRRDVPALLALGVMTGVMSVAFLAAIDRVALGTAVAVQFLGPLTVAAVFSRTRRALAWPALALVGVVLVTEPWRGTTDTVGLACAALAAVGWAAYIVLTQRVGDRFAGTTGLSLTVPVAAATAAVVGVPEAVGRMTPANVLAALGLALLFPVLTFVLEMRALRRMTSSAFGTLMAVEPALGVVFGLLVLVQVPSPTALLGTLLVVVAGAAAQRDGRRRAPVPDRRPVPCTS